MCCAQVAGLPVTTVVDDAAAGFEAADDAPAAALEAVPTFDCAVVAAATVVAGEATEERGVCAEVATAVVCIGD